MARIDLKNKIYKLDSKFKGYFGDNDTATQEYMEKVKSDLSNKEAKDSNEESALKWISSELGDASEKIAAPKRIRMQTGGPGSKSSVNPESDGNNFLKGTHKDNDNSNLSDVGGLPSPHKGSMRRQIMTGQMQYENIDKEIEAARYLIEYMNNNKKQL